MKTNLFMTRHPLTDGTQTPLLTLNPTCPLPTPPNTNAPIPGEAIRHILLGSPGAVRQTIHLLHSLHYAETVLWSPVMRVEEQIVITPEQGETMSLLRRLV